MVGMLDSDRVKVAIIINNIIIIITNNIIIIIINNIIITIISNNIIINIIIIKPYLSQGEHICPLCRVFAYIEANTHTSALDKLSPNMR